MKTANTTFENLNEQEMVNVIGGDKILQITDGDGNVQEVTGPYLFQSKPGTKRAVLALTDTLCMTFHALEATTVDEAESELVESEPASMYAPGNLIRHNVQEVLT